MPRADQALHGIWLGYIPAEAQGVCRKRQQKRGIPGAEEAPDLEIEAQPDPLLAKEVKASWQRITSKICVIAQNREAATSIV